MMLKFISSVIVLSFVVFTCAEQGVLQAGAGVGVDHVWNTKYPNIIVQTKSGAKPGVLVDIADNNQAQNFVKFVKDTLDKIYGIKKIGHGDVGKQLFQELAATGKTIRIFLKDAGGPGTFRDPMTVATEHLQLLKHFQPLFMMDSFDFESDSRRIARANLYDAINPIQPQTYAAAAQNFDRILRRYVSDKKATLNNNDDLTTVNLGHKDSVKKITQLAQKVGLTAQQIQDISSVTYVPTAEQYWKLVFELYPFMESGGGCDVLVGMAHQEKFEETAGVYKPKKNFEDAPAAIVLAHELVHALHIASGRRLVRSGWEEEALTTGLKPFSKMEKLTENTLRAAAGLPQRKYYGMIGNRAWHSAFTINLYCETVSDSQRDMCNAKKATIAQGEITDKYTTVQDAKTSIDTKLAEFTMKATVITKEDDQSVFRALCEAGKKNAMYHDKLEPLLFANGTVCNSDDGHKSACATVVAYAAQYNTVAPFPATKCTSLAGWDSAVAEEAAKTIAMLLDNNDNQVPLNVHIITFEHNHVYGLDNVKGCRDNKQLCIVRNYGKLNAWAAVVPLN